MKKNNFFIVFMFFLAFASFSEEKKLPDDFEKPTVLTNDSAVLSMTSYDYFVTPGDIYILSYSAGTTPVVYNILVDLSYKVRISNLAVINAKGLTFLQLKSKVENIVTKNYPLSGVQFIMKAPGVFNILVKGEVKKAVEVKTSGLVRLSELIKTSLTKYSSIRNIDIISFSGEKKSYDLFKAEREGDLSQNPFLKPGDVVRINRLKRSVEISGGVERPGIYQLLDGENIKDLIEIYGGGLTEFAENSSLFVRRNGKTNEFPLGSALSLNSRDEIDKFELNNNDYVWVGNALELKPIVYFEGAINIESITDKKDGKKIKADTGLNTNESLKNEKENLDVENVITVSFNDGDDLVSMLRAKRTLFSNMSDTQNAHLVRNGVKIFSNFNRIFYDAGYNERIPLEPNDRIIVPFLKQVVTVAGAVAKPGQYPYHPGKTWEFYVAQAGGFNIDRNMAAAVTIKTASGKKLSKKDYILPDSIITAKTNSFFYHFTKYAAVVTTILTIISSTLAIIAATRR